MPQSLNPVLVAGAPKPVGPYSSAVVVGDLVFVSGQSGRDPATDAVSDDVEVQTEVCLHNIRIILEAAGTTLSRVVRCGVFLVNMKDFEKMNGVYARTFGDHRPARTTVAVCELPGPGLKVEIDCVALVPGADQ